MAVWNIYDHLWLWWRVNKSKHFQNHSKQWSSRPVPLTGNVFAQKPVTQMKDLVLFSQTAHRLQASYINNHRYTAGYRTRLARSLRTSIFFQSLIFLIRWIFQTIGLYIKQHKFPPSLRCLLNFFNWTLYLSWCPWGIGANFLVSLLRDYGNIK